MSTFSPFGGSPISGFHELFGQYAKNEKHFIKYSLLEQQQIEVDRRFTKTLVKNVTGLTDTVKLQQFLDGYKPAYQDMVKMSDYDLIGYVKRSYEGYKKNGQQPPKLNKLF